MGQINLTIPQPNQPNATADPQVATDLTTIANAINGNLDSTNVTNGLAQSAEVNTGSQIVKGAVNIPASQSVTSTTYALMGTPDQVAGIVLPANGLIAVWYQATWQESVAGAARAAIFLGSNQIKIEEMGAAAPVVQAAATGSVTNVNQANSLTSFAGGLVSGQSSAYGGDVATGQVVGMFGTGTGGDALYTDTNGVTTLTAAGSTTFAAGACVLFAATGTYTVSVQFKASSGSVTAQNRKLWVRVLSFA